MKIVAKTAEEAKACRCPRCGARPGNRCTNPQTGSKRRRPHDERVRAAWASRTPSTKRRPRQNSAVRVTRADGSESIVKASAFKKFGPYDDRKARGV